MRSEKGVCEGSEKVRAIFHSSHTHAPTHYKPDAGAAHAPTHYKPDAGAAHAPTHYTPDAGAAQSPFLADGSDLAHPYP